MSVFLLYVRGYGEGRGRMDLMLQLVTMMMVDPQWTGKRGIPVFSTTILISPRPSTISPVAPLHYLFIIK